jgi:CheY-like chemotaxis protein
MDTPQQKRVRHVLVADDDRNDFLLVNLAFQKAGLSVNLSHVLDGQQAVNFLTANGHFKERASKPLPDLLLLDLKMPMMDGFDVLTFLKNHPSLRDLAVVVLSASQIQEDISRALQLGAADFLTKPADFSELVAMMRSIFSRWLAEPGNHDAESKTVY